MNASDYDNILHCISTYLACAKCHLNSNVVTSENLECPRNPNNQSIVIYKYQVPYPYLCLHLAFGKAIHHIKWPMMGYRR